MALVPSGTQPNLQVQWLEQTLKDARAEGSGVEMIVVQFHFPLASVDTGNSCDMGIRAAFGPLFDKYEVDITLSGHNHNYCRSLPSRGYTPLAGKVSAAVTNPFGTYAAGAVIDTRCPTPTQTAPIVIDGEQVFDTGKGTVHLVVGGGGAGSTIGETFDAANGLAQAHPFVAGSGTTQAVEDAAWLAYYDHDNAYGYAVFDVDPGDGPGQTSITFQWFSVTDERAGADHAAREARLHAPVVDREDLGGRAVDRGHRERRAHGRRRSRHVVAGVGRTSPTSGCAPASRSRGRRRARTRSSPATSTRSCRCGSPARWRATTRRPRRRSASSSRRGVLRPAVVTVSGAPQVGGTVTADASRVDAGGRPHLPVAAGRLADRRRHRDVVLAGGLRRGARARRSGSPGRRRATARRR